jgi:hypothetical protein
MLKFLGHLSAPQGHTGRIVKKCIAHACLIGSIATYGNGSRSETWIVIVHDLSSHEEKRYKPPARDEKPFRISLPESGECFFYRKNPVYRPDYGSVVCLLDGIGSSVAASCTPPDNLSRMLLWRPVKGKGGVTNESSENRFEITLGCNVLIP